MTSMVIDTWLTIFKERSKYFSGDMKSDIWHKDTDPENARP